MEKKTVLITGCRGGIGRDTAVRLALRGHHVIATVHREESVDELKAYAKSQGVSLDVFKLDILEASERKKVQDLKVDVLVNNAAIGESGPLLEVPMERVRSNFETNLFGTMELTRQVLSMMMKRDSGRVIFISSIAGRLPMSFWGPYSMTKFSLSAAASILRDELKLITRNVFVSVVEPGTYHTGFNQRVMATRYAWLNESSFFHGVIEKYRKNEEANFKMLERKSTVSIVNKIVESVESKKPRLRYSAPWWQALFVGIARAFGR